MANTSVVYTRIDTELKEEAEEILAQLGISPASAIRMFYSQIVLQKGMPFEFRQQIMVPLTLGTEPCAELDDELRKGVESIKAGNTVSADEVDSAFAKQFCI